MRKIQITNELKSKVDLFYKNLFVSRSSKFTKPKRNLKNLIGKAGFKLANRVKYIEYLIKYYDEIQKATPDEFQKWCSDFDKIINHKELTLNFWRRIVKALGYKQLREKEFLEFYDDLGIKSCIYCNAQLAVNVEMEFYKTGSKEGQVKKRKATFELDHFLPKSEYPFLATSFFNLYPSCSICNKAKSYNANPIVLFEESSDLDFFNFRVNPKSMQNFWSTKDRTDLKIELRHSPGFQQKIKDYNKLFQIKGIYDTQKDIVEELLNKKAAYTQAYKRGLINLSNKKIFPDEAMINRLIIGTYDKPEDIHKRPLSKFTQDIARQLKLIK